jgi:hypothetical protein
MHQHGDVVQPAERWRIPGREDPLHEHRWGSLSRCGRPVKPSSINRELTILRTMFNVAIRGVGAQGGAPERNLGAPRPAFEQEHNKRDVVLSSEELDRLLAVSPKWLQPVIMVAYDSGMRRGGSRSFGEARST